MRKLYKLGLSILSGLLLAFAWPQDGFAPLLFIALIPLLLIESDYWTNRLHNKSTSFLGYAATTFIIFNSLTTYWIYNATLVGVIAAVIINTILMSGAFFLFHITHRKMHTESAGYIALIAYWLSYEYLHLRWDLNWPWLNLGNGFASFPRWIQWYEFTGCFGGSLWVLVVNILLMRFVQLRFIRRICSRDVALLMASALFLLIIPVVISQIMYSNYKEKEHPLDVVIVQPNLDPYSEQYDLDPVSVTRRMLAQAASKSDSLTDCIVFPESAVQEHAWEDQIDNVPSVQILKDFVSKYPHMSAIVGMSTRKIFAEGEPLSMTARKFRDAERYYDAYNTALYVSNKGELGVYHKSKLTPGVEQMPYPKLFKFLEKFALDLGGTIGSLAKDPNQKPFQLSGDGKVASVICYESVYGEFVNRFINNGANVIFVITNDGWWGNTAGHRQHLLFSRLRAIETRRSVARSANTGISCFINQRGDISQATQYWVPATIKSVINLNDKVTFYVRYGDYIARVFLLVAALMFLLTISQSFGLRKSVISKEAIKD